MLATVDGAKLPTLFSNRLEADDITAIFRALARTPGGGSEPHSATHTCVHHTAHLL